MIIENQHFQQKHYKFLLPKPKTHLFMKRFTRIQAIDRQIRKNWIKIKRQKDKRQIQKAQNLFSPIKILREPQIKNQTNQQLIKSRLLVDSKKRLKILSNHKKNQDIYYRKHQKNENRCKSQDEFQSKLFRQANSYKANSNTINNLINQESTPRLKHIKSCSSELQKNHAKNKQKFGTLQSIKVEWSGQFMLRKRMKTKQKQLQIMKFQSEKQMQRINKRIQFSQKKRIDLQKSLLKKMQRSKIYYDLIKPINFQEYQN